VDRHFDDATSFSSERQEWEREQLEIKKVAARFPKRYAEELEAELAVALIKLKRRRPSGIHDWKAYLITALAHRALTLVDKWRAQERREMGMDLYAETSESSLALAEADSEQLENRLALSELRNKLNDKSFGLLLVLAASNQNQSLAAQLLGIHRNTIRRRLHEIRRRLRECPIENVSGPSAPMRLQSSATLRLTAEQWQQLAFLAQDSRWRGAFKGRLILALGFGQSYTQIQRRLKTTAPTIVRWKRRFEKDGIAGLKSLHRGRMSQMTARRFQAKWLRAVRRTCQSQELLSCRKIAKELGISKSTAHRFLKAARA
jgi:transposase/DNA-directed RNA polymerase specialized sigma24 family protein